jgi:hypothetical protein
MRAAPLLLQPPAARATRVRTPLPARCARAAPPPPQLRARRLLFSVHRSASLRPPPRRAAPSRTRCSALSDDALADVQRWPEAQARAYAPHELLRAALQLSDGAARRDVSYLHAPSLPAAALLTRCAPALRWAELQKRGHGRHRVVLDTPRCDNNNDHAGALRADDGSAAPAPPDEGAAARGRLLCLLDALEAAAPEVLRGRQNNANATKQPSVHQLTERVGTLAAFAAHVSDEAWAQPPETWTPHKKHRCARVVLHARSWRHVPLLTRAHRMNIAHAAWPSSCAALWITSPARAFLCRACCTAPSEHGMREAPQTRLRCARKTRPSMPSRRALQKRRRCGAALRTCMCKWRAAAASGAGRLRDGCWLHVHGLIALHLRCPHHQGCAAVAVSDAVHHTRSCARVCGIVH